MEVGLDLFGHYFIKHGLTRASSKRWVMVIACCWTRAVNLEVVMSESTLSAHLALERHCSVYNKPDYINTDNGGCYEGIFNDLQEQWAFMKDVAGQMSACYAMPK